MPRFDEHDVFYLARLIESRFLEIKEILMSSQADVDALTAQVTQLQSSLTSDVQAIQAEIQTLQASGVDVTALQSAVSGLSSTVDSAGQIAPAPVNPSA